MKHQASLTKRLLQWSMAVLLLAIVIQAPANSQNDAKGNDSSYHYLKELAPIPLGTWEESSFDLYNLVPGAFSRDAVLSFESCGASCLRVGLYSPEGQCRENCYVFHTNRLIEDGDILYADNQNINNNCKISAFNVQGKNLSEHRCLDTPELGDGTSLYFSTAGNHLLVVGTYNAKALPANASGQFWSVNADDNTHRVLKLPSHEIYQPESSVYLKGNGLWLLYETALHSFYLCFYPIANNYAGMEWEPVCFLLPEDGIYQLYPVVIDGESRVLARTANGMGLLNNEQHTSQGEVAWSWLKSNVSSAYSSNYYSIPALPPLIRDGSIYLAGNAFDIENAERPTPFVARYNLETGVKEADLFIPLESEYRCNRIVGQPVLNDSGEYLYVVLSSRRCACGFGPCNEQDRKKNKSERLVLNPDTLELLDRHILGFHMEPITDVKAVSSGFYINKDGSEVLFESVSCTGEDNPDNTLFNCNQGTTKDNDRNYLMLALEVKPASAPSSQCTSVPDSGCHQIIKIIPVRTNAMPVTTPTPAYLPSPTPSLHPDGYESDIMKEVNKIVPYYVGFSEILVFAAMLTTYLIYYKYFKTFDTETQPLLPE